MSDNSVSPDTDNLDDFEALFTGKATATPHVTEEPEAPTIEDVKEDNPEDHALATEDTDADASDDAPVDEQDDDAKPKKKTYQERMNEVTAARRAAEREAEAERAARQLLEQRLAELEARLPSKTEDKVEAPAKASAEPDPDEINEDGSPKYPLGEYDPKYIRDLVHYTNEQDREAARIAAEQQDAQHQAEAATAALTEQWQAKVAAVEETIPDIREKADALDSAFINVDPSYGQYLATTIMAMDHGPEVLNYLAENIDEAKAIVSLGHVGATIALGELHGQFKSKPTSKPKVTSAPEPPPVRVRGSSGKFTVADDTDDLTAFESKFYGK